MINFLLDLEACKAGSDTLFVFQIARNVIRILQIAVPFALIIWGSLDFFKAVIAGDDKEMKQKRKPFIQRVVAALIILLMPVIINVIMKNIASSSNNNFAKCWNAAGGTKVDMPDTGSDDTWSTKGKE